MDGTILSIGTFTQPATAVNQTIMVPSNLDYLNIYNYTQFGANAGANANQFYWQRGMGTIGTYRAIAGGVATSGLTAASAFVLYNPSTTPSNAPIAITNINAGTGLVLTANTVGLSIGSIIRFSQIAVLAGQQYNGVAFSVTAINPGVSFTIVPLTPSAAIGATAGFYTLINPSLFMPRRYIISNITAAAQAVVTTTVNNNYAVGMNIRFTIPTVNQTSYGITALDTVSATIVAINAANQFTVNFNTVGLPAFSFPAANLLPFSYATVYAYGDNTGVALAQTPPLSGLEDATFNTGYLGITLAPGALLPGGVANDVIYWNAGKVTYGGL